MDKKEKIKKCDHQIRTIQTQIKQRKSKTFKKLQKVQDILECDFESNGNWHLTQE